MINFFKKLWKWLKGIPEEHSEEQRRDLAMFGVWQSPSGPRLILEKQAVGLFACSKCKGYGTWGMPLCGALYRCNKCNGTGKR